MSGNEQKYIDEAFRSNWVVPLGPNVDGFEADLHHFMLKDHPQLEHKQVVALSSGTAAIHLALLGCGVGPGDEVCVQSFTFCASCNPVRYVGGVPILIDSEPDTWNMDPTLLEQAIVERKSITGRYPKAIIVVALYGMPYHIEAIMDIANRYDWFTQSELTDMIAISESTPGPIGVNMATYAGYRAGYV
jgi:dTDP-4-amino-4,6-dideoxygalactose transaminase